MRLRTQLENSHEIKKILRKINRNFKLKGRAIETLLIFLPFNNGVCDHTDLLKVIKESLLTNFVLSCSEIKKKLAIKDAKAPEELFRKAVRKLSQHTAKGELGELLLYTLLDVYFEAPKILSKISLKTSRRVAVFGADAVHAQFVDGKLRLYMGESKLHRSFSIAASSAAKSISNSLEKYCDEFDLIDSHIDFPEMTSEMRSKLMDYLNPFSETSGNVSDDLYTPCFIGFVEPTVFSNNEIEYESKYIEVAKTHILEFYEKLQDEGNDIHKTALLLLPFSSIDDFVDEFVNCMGIEK